MEHKIENFTAVWEARIDDETPEREKEISSFAMGSPTEARRNSRTGAS